MLVEKGEYKYVSEKYELSKKLSQEEIKRAINEGEIRLNKHEPSSSSELKSPADGLNNIISTLESWSPAEYGAKLGLILGTVMATVFLYKIHPVLGIITAIAAILKIIPQFYLLPVLKIRLLSSKYLHT
ncbi:MAG: hypothetical protein QNK31_06230 [Porticoccus sp.]|nr:hypothetical protein [Porticoccus sp.]